MHLDKLRRIEEEKDRQIRLAREKVEAEERAKRERERLQKEADEQAVKAKEELRQAKREQERVRQEAEEKAQEEAQPETAFQDAEEEEFYISSSYPKPPALKARPKYNSPFFPSGKGPAAIPRTPQFPVAPWRLKEVILDLPRTAVLTRHLWGGRIASPKGERPPPARLFSTAFQA